MCFKKIIIYGIKKLLSVYLPKKRFDADVRKLIDNKGLSDEKFVK